MEFKTLNATIQSTNADALIVGLFESENAPAVIDQALNGAVRDLLGSNDFRGRPNEVAVLYTRGLIPAPRVILVGLGQAGQLTLNRVREATAAGAKKARDLGCKSIAATALGAEKLDRSLAAQTVVEDALLGLYRWRVNHTSPTDRPNPESLTIVEEDAANFAAVETGVRAGQAVAAGVYRARNLVNQAPNILTPAGLAQAAQEMAQTAGVKCTVHDLDWIQAQNMNAYLAVAKGSDNPPKFIELEYNGADGAPIVFVGKGLTFDSGGISLKSADGMEDMRDDMGGAAAVIGAIEAIAKMKLPLHIVGLIAATENLPGGHATRPADVVHARNGKTIEIVNTDAEGRLTLADALCYAADFHPQAVIDLATLTGACVTALGENVAAGYFANDDSLAQKVEAASQVSGEKLWRLPLFPDYHDKIRTDYADLKNTGGGKGGVGSSAVFLQEFTSYLWTHWDIAGMVLDKVGSTPVYPHTHPPHIVRGATGFGVRALVSLARNWK